MVGKHMSIDMDCNGGTGHCSPPNVLLWGARKKSVSWVPLSKRL
jgi:hypothetical protein